VGDNMSADQAKLVRDSRGMPEFVFDPRKGETAAESFDLKGNPSVDRDWWRAKVSQTGEEYDFTVAHWALTEGRFRKHVKSVKEEDTATMIPFSDLLGLITQDDVVHRRVFAGHRGHLDMWISHFPGQHKDLAKRTLGC
jgi:pyruvate-ferredoxin/flavodoxin oxidoreductase